MLRLAGRKGGGGDRWAGEGWAGVASPALGGRRVRNEAAESRIQSFMCSRAFAQGGHISPGREDPGVTFQNSDPVHTTPGWREGEEDKGDEESCEGRGGKEAGDGYHPVPRSARA